MNSLKSKVKELESKVLKDTCDTCDCMEECKNKKLKKAIEDKLNILKGNKTVLK